MNPSNNTAGSIASVSGHSIHHLQAGGTPHAALCVRDLRKHYDHIEAVKGLSFEIAEGEIFGLLGPNGAGKTTTISMLATQQRPTSGDAFIFGRSVLHDQDTVQQLLGVVPQDIALYPRLTPVENIKFFGRMYRVPGGELLRRVDELLKLVGLEGRRDDYVETFSGGMKRRLNLAVSLIHRPRVLLLDEPTVGVDPHSREHIFTIVTRLRAEGAAILYTTHYMEEAERLCDRIGIMDEGRIIAMGSLESLLAEAGCWEIVELRGLPPRADLSRLEAAPGVCRIEQQDGVARLFVSRAASVLAPLDQALQPFPAGVSVQITPLSLESLFLQLTGKALRD
jgi:ABC-2 type transport system ATP-binding protein